MKRELKPHARMRQRIMDDVAAKDAAKTSKEPDPIKHDRFRTAKQKYNEARIAKCCMNRRPRHELPEIFRPCVDCPDSRWSQSSPTT